jgi:methionyl-tRNA formyltransferase
MQASPSAVKALALARRLDLFQPRTLKNSDAIARLRAAAADAMVVAAYGLLLPPHALEVCPYGAINIHASLLPRWRGAAPIQRALLAGDEETGVSIMQMDAGLDTGPVFAQRRIAIGREDDSGSLHDKLATLGGDALIEVLHDLEHGRARAVPQPEMGATYARKIEKSETRLQWTHPAAELERAVRAFRPAPGAHTQLRDQPLKIWRARVVAGAGEPGSVLERDARLHIACGVDALAIEELQPAGGRRMSAAQFLRGRHLAHDARFA